jgi:dephospho-CoA kinase
MKAPTFSIGLTGGIGCGKTTVADLFAERGVSVIDTDLIAHQQTAPGGAAMPAIAQEFGDAFITPEGALDRTRMRELVFNDPAAKIRLEQILHPLIRAQTQYQASIANGVYLMFVVPLLVESGTWKQNVNRVLVIDCPESLQIQRVMARNGLSETQVLAIMAAQVPRAVRLAAANDVIQNQGDMQTLILQIDHMHQQYLNFIAQN